jgi:predicted Zn-dependent peptidase
MIKNIFRHTFHNGFTLQYIRKVKSPLIDVQIWVSVGSAYEAPSEYGICHMIEHMIFKGSKNIGLGELDDIIYQMNGSTNAFTTKEFTAYTFSVPKDFLRDLIKIISLVFDAPRFDEDDLEVEKQVVIQEILSYQDDPFSVLLDNAFQYGNAQYNYRHPILGTIDSVSQFSSADLIAFYSKYYVAGRMTCFVTGDISKKELLEIIDQSYFVDLPLIENNQIQIPRVSSGKNKRDIHYAYSASMNNHFLITFVLKSPTYYFFYLYKALDIILGADKDSLLYKKLCVQLQLVTSIKTFFYTFSEETFFFIYFVPIDLVQVSNIIQEVYNMIEEVKNNLLDKEILEKVYNILYFDYSMLKTEQAEDFIFEKIPYIIKEKRNYMRFPLRSDFDQLAKQIKFVAGKLVYKNVSINAVIHSMHNPFATSRSFTEEPISPGTKDIAPSIEQPGSDFKNESLYESYKKFTESIQERHITQTKIKERFGLRKRHLTKYCPLPKHELHVLENGMKVIFINNFHKEDDLVIFSLSLDIKHYYEEACYEGGLGFLFDLMYHGTHTHPGQSFIDYIEQYGIYFSFSIGEISIRCVNKHLSHAINVLLEYLTEPELSEVFFDLVKKQIIESIHNFNDDQMMVATQFAKSIMYKDHPFSQNPGGTLDSIAGITYEYITSLYKKYVFSDNAILICNGMISDQQKNEILSRIKKFNRRNEIQFHLPDVSTRGTQGVYYKYIDKQQVVVSLLAYSVPKYTKDYYALILAEQLLCGTLGNSMHSLLFALRECFGYFYYIAGSLTYNCTKQPGLIMIQAMTSQEFVETSCFLIMQLLRDFLSYLTDYDVYLAKQALLFCMNHKNDLRSTQNASLMNAYRYNLNDKDLAYFYHLISGLTKKDIIEVVQKYITQDTLSTLVVRKATSV